MLTVAAEYALIAGAIAISVALQDKVGPGAGCGIMALAVLVIGTRQYALGEAVLHGASHGHRGVAVGCQDRLGHIP